MNKPCYRIFASPFLFLLFLCVSGLLFAQDKRSRPLDFYLIVDGSSRLADTKTEAVAWINSHVIDSILQEGDSLTVWSAGDKAQVVYAGTIGAARDEVRNTLKNLDISGKNADFTGALREAVSRADAARDANRLPVTMVVTGSAEALAPSLDGGSGGLLRWSRLEKYARWQALIAAPEIGAQVTRAAAAYISGK
jgi:hypothetical protein